MSGASQSLRNILCVSIPRSGHHYLASLIRDVLGDQCFYCEFYTPVDCCRSIPCSRGERAKVVVQKNHDFDLSTPPNLPGVIYVIQYRHPVMAVLSDREYLARLEGQARADDADEFKVWLGGKAAHFRLFWDKWIAGASDERIVIEYSELLRHPEVVILRVLQAVDITVERARLDAAVRKVSGFVADFPPPATPLPFQARSIETSRYFDQDLMAVYESMLLDTMPGLEPTRCLPHVESSGHPTRLVYDAALATYRGAHREAAVSLRKAADAAPGNPFVSHELSLALLRAGDREAAIAAADESLRLRPDNPSLIRHLSDLHNLRSAAGLEQAIALGHSLVALCPDDPGHLVHLASLLMRRGEHQAAAELARRAMLNSPADASVWRECSEVLKTAGDRAGAVRAVQEALTRRPDHAEFHQHYGNLFHQAGDADAAISEHMRALALAPEEVFWRSALAGELAAAGRTGEARAVIERGLRDQPDNDELLKHLERLNAVDRLNASEAGATKSSTQGKPTETPTRQDVILAYKFLLGRDPESEAVIEAHLTAHSRHELIRRFLASDEFAARFGTGMRLTPLQHPVQGLRPRLKSLLSAFGPSELPAPNPASWVDALGVQTRCAYRTDWADRAGRVIPEVDVESIEWLALLESVEGARQRYCMIELGAGFGPWLVRAGTAWRRHCPGRPLMLVGVEGEPEHFQFLRQHVADNELPAESVRLLQAAVGDRDGEGAFETSQSPSFDWGTRLVGGPPVTGLPRPAGTTSTLTRVISLETLAADLGQIDFLHVDIQGSEVDVLSAGAEVVRHRTSRLLVGTHSRAIESQLIDVLGGLDFRLEFEQPCRYRLDPGPPVLVEDGVQYWVKRAH